MSNEQSDIAIQAECQRSEMPTRFMGKTWIVIAQVVVFGWLALISLVMGPLYLFGLIKDVNGAPATDAGIALTAMTLPLLLILALAVFNLNARRKPLLRLYREGIEIVLIGPSSLDEVPLVPIFVRIAWSILSMQGFRRRLVHIPWRNFQIARVLGLPMHHQLTIDATLPIGGIDEQPHGATLVSQIMLPECEFSISLNEIAAAINFYAGAPTVRGRLENWAGDELRRE